MPLSVLDPPRLERELDLRRRGYVPLSRPDALFPAFTGLVPRCRVRQDLPPGYSRLLWCHPGRSGVDPRAVAPLALLRVADGLGDDPLDPPLDLVGAARWLLDGDVLPWLLRPAHRLLVGHEGDRCRVERDARTTLCFVHVVGDELLQQVAAALGDRSFRGCHVNVGHRSTPGRGRSTT